MVDKANESRAGSSGGDGAAAADAANKDTAGAPAADNALPDTVAGHRLYETAPRWARPYLQMMRLERPIGYRLLWLPCLWGLALSPAVGERAISMVQLLGYVILFYLGALVMRAAGCIFNDMVDRDIDTKVERTKNRPLAAGRVNMFSAGALLALNLTIGAAVLLAFDPTTVVVGLAVMPLVVAYPFMKRIMGIPQLVLGMAFNWGVLVAWSATGGNVLTAAPLLLYLAGVMWTIGYDTVYATQDIEDDEVVGVRSFALTVSRIGKGALRPAVAISYAISFALMLAAMEYAGLNRWSWLAMAPVAAHMAWQVAAWNVRDAASSLAIFRANAYCGWLVVAGLVVANLLGRF